MSISLSGETKQEKDGICLAPDYLKGLVTGRTDKCVVLDIDECMVHTFEDRWDIYGTIMSDPDYFPIRERLYNLKVSGGRMWGVRRPYLFEFLQFCTNYFREVNVWTAGTRQYANAIVPQIFRDLPPPANVYARENTERPDGRTAKPLYKIVSDQVQLHNTYTIDNSADYMRYNIHNGLVVNDYDPKELSDIYVCDATFPMIMRWLNLPEVRRAPDVRQLDKSSIFIN